MASWRRLGALATPGMRCWSSSVVLFAPHSAKTPSRRPGQRQGGRRRRRSPWTGRPKPEDVNPEADWPSVFQTAKPYDPYLVPLPIRMGRPETGILPPTATANLELMKITNFLHLTPPAILEHCKALKPLCTEWPDRLPPLPLRVDTRNYVFPGHTIRHPGSRKVTIKFCLKDLTLTEHARKKMVTLAGSRYDPGADTITLVGKRCPTRKQNHDYVMYLLKVLYLESHRVEPWETQEDTLTS